MRKAVRKVKAMVLSRGSYAPKYLFQIIAFFLVAFAIPLTVYIAQQRQIIEQQAQVVSQEAVRGQAGDLWADIVLGHVDFNQAVPGEVVPFKVNNPGGVAVDRNVHPNRIYVYDGANSRILGYSSLGVCSDNPAVKCTINSECPSSTCNVTARKDADIVFGQPATRDYSACNGDGNIENYPYRKPASASTLCSTPEHQNSPREGGSFVSMYVDNQSNLYVPDFHNDRILKYSDPFNTDTIADEVWGQDDFSGNRCNKTDDDQMTGSIPNPTASSLCMGRRTESFTAGVTLDSSGNMWVADSTNHRVLRFPQASGVIAKTADLVLGNDNFTSRVGGSALNQMNQPASVRVGSDGKVYVADLGNNRVLVFNPPFTNGMLASSTFGTNLNRPAGLEFEPDNSGLWVSDNGNNMLELWDLDGQTLKKVLLKDTFQAGGCGTTTPGASCINPLPNGSCAYVICDSRGSLGIDTDGNVYATGSQSFQDLYRFPAPIPTPQAGKLYSSDKQLFSPPAGSNYLSDKGLSDPQGLVVKNNQLIVSDGKRVLFWNVPSGPDSLSNGKPADGYIEAADFNTPNIHGIGAISADDQGHLLVVKSFNIDLFQLPLTSGVQPVKQWLNGGSSLPVLGGGQVSFRTQPGITDIEIEPSGNFLWLAEGGYGDENRVLRVRDPFTNPVVDVILGQANSTDTLCNRLPDQNTGEPTGAKPNTVCRPGHVTVDKLGNVWVSDHALEFHGNKRILEFNASRFINLTTALMGPDADLVSPWVRAWKMAFDSQNRMVTGYNGQISPPPFTGLYAFPLQTLQTTTVSDVTLKDFMSHGFASVFDNQDNLYITDLNRGRILVYKTPFSSLTPPSPTPVPDISSGMVGYWKFDEGSGTTAADSSGGANNGTLLGTSWTGGKLGSGLSLNGTSSYISIPDNPSLQFGSGDFSVFAWIKTNAAQNLSFVTKRGAGGSGWYFGSQTQDKTFFYPGSMSQVINFRDDVWRQIGVIRSGRTMTYYLDGNAVGSFTDSGNFTNTDPLLVGKDGSGGDMFQGIIDEVRIYNRALSFTNIRDLNNYSGTPLPSPTPTLTPTPTVVIPTPTPTVPIGGGGSPILTSTATPTTVPTPTPVPCSIASASWNAASNPVTEGTSVSLQVTGTGSCSGQQVNLEVWENDSITEGVGDDPVTTQPVSVVFAGNTATTTWTTEWQSDCLGLCNPPEYYFQAALGGGSPVRSADPLLSVNQITIPTPTPTPITTTEWTQDGHDAQRTGYSPEEPLEPWTYLWSWNGPDASGGLGGHTYNAPREARTVMGGGNIYAPAGASGLYAVRTSNGSQAWRVTAATFNATPVYGDGFVYAGGANGQLYKINASNGTVSATYNAGSPLNKSVLLAGNYAFVVTDSGELHKVDTSNMSGVWVYTAGSTIATPPSFSAAKNTIVYATDDLYVHAVNNLDGSRKWRVKPSPNTAGFPNQFEMGWPVIAEQHGIVFVRMQLEHNAMSAYPGINGIFPNSLATTRTWLQNNPQYKNLFALDLDNGLERFIPAVGYGSTEDVISGSAYGVMGSQPVVKVWPNGQEVAYIHFRNGQGNPLDYRWDGSMGEMVLDNTTIPGLVAGDLRFVNMNNYQTQTGPAYTHIIDEQEPITMGGDSLFHAHWGASESIRITDRSNTRGLTYGSPILTNKHPTVIYNQQSCANRDNITHYTTCGLTLNLDGRYWEGPGFWVYWNITPPFSPIGSTGYRPKYTYVSSGLMVVEGSFGEVTVFRHSGTTLTPTPFSTPSPTSSVSPTPTPTSSPLPTLTPGGTTTASVRVSNTSQDGSSTGTTINTLPSSAPYSLMFVGYDSGTAGNTFDGGWIFNTTIPQGATIQSAALTLTGSTDNSGNVTGAWYGYNVDSVADFTNGAAGQRISDHAARTTQSAVDNFTAVGSGATHITPSLSSVIQSIVNRPSFVGKLGLTYRSSNTTDNWQSWVDYSTNPSQAALLTVTYTNPVGGPLPTATPTTVPTPTPTPAPCSISSASWNALSNPVTEGTSVFLQVTGAGSCLGQTVNFEVWENDSVLEGVGDDPVTTQPASVTFSGTTATTIWTTEWQSDCLGLCNPPEYYFNASLPSGSPVRSADPLLSVNQAVAGAGPQILNLAASSNSVGKFDKIEWSFDLSNVYTNPYYSYDPADTQAANSGTPGANQSWFGVDGVSVDINLTSPTGKTIKVPGFWMEDYLRINNGGMEVLGKRNNGRWMVRFAPSETGTYQYYVTAQDKTGTGRYPATGTQSFIVTASSNKGFIRQSSKDPRFMAYDNGEPYIPIAAGQQWWDDGGLRSYDYENAFNIFGANKINLVRVWDLMDFALGVEGAQPVWVREGFSNVGAALGIEINTANVRTGLRSARPSPGQGWYQRLAIAEPTRQHKLTAWIRTTSLTGQAQVNMTTGNLFNSGSVIAQLPPVTGTTAWAQYSVTFTPNNQALAINLLQSGGSGTMYVDDVSFGPTDGSGNIIYNIISDAGMERHFAKDAIGNDPDANPSLPRPRGTYMNSWAAYELDKIVESAQANGIAIQLCSCSGPWFTWPVNQDSATWTDPWFVKSWERNFRYRVARWGYSPSILAWEKENEHGHVVSGDPIYSFYQSYGSYQAATDPYKHLRTTSQGSQAFSPGLWSGTGAFDNANYHDYMMISRYPASLTNDAANFVYRFAWCLRNPSTAGYCNGLAGDGSVWAGAQKPWVWGEIGVGTTVWNEANTAGTSGEGGRRALHNGMWAGLFSPLGTTPLDWYWQQEDSFLNNPTTGRKWLERRYAANFFSGVDYDGGNFTYVMSSTDAPPGYSGETVAVTNDPTGKARVYAMRRADRKAAYLWVQHRDHTWANSGTPAAISPRITVANLLNEAYTVEIWNTYTGTISSTSTVTPTAGSLSIALNSLTDDAAVKVVSASAPIPTPTVVIPTPTPTVPIGGGGSPILTPTNTPVPPTPTTIPTATPTPTPTPVPFTVTGTVFTDINRNGVRDTGETGYAGATVNLSTIGNQLTNASGVYSFISVAAGTYTVALTVPSGYQTTTTNPVIVVASITTTVNYGIAPIPTNTPALTLVPTATPTSVLPTPTRTPTLTPTPVPTYTLSGIVYEDVNSNGVQESGERGYGGATVEVLSPLQTIVTNGSGRFAFANLSAGNYAVSLTVPSGYRVTTINPVQVILGSSVVVNFGISLVPTPTPTSTPVPTATRVPAPISTPTPTLVPTPVVIEAKVIVPSLVSVERGRITMRIRVRREGEQVVVVNLPTIDVETNVLGEQILTLPALLPANYELFVKVRGHLQKKVSFAHSSLGAQVVVSLLAGDVNSDGKINALDIGRVIEDYAQTSSSPADLNLDGVVNAQDIGFVLNNYLQKEDAQ